jgi:NADH-quinone oxidoreductase subunit H
MVSYEVAIGLILVTVLGCVGSLNFFSIVLFQEFLFFFVPLFPIFFMFLVSILAETNRAPFDLPEAESELVSGYNVEYASMGFALFFLAEYSSMILMSSLTTIIFLGGWVSIFAKPFILDSFVLAFKLSFILFFFYLGSCLFSKIQNRSTYEALLKSLLAYFAFFCSDYV